MEIVTILIGDLQENCYLIIKESKCLVVDPGGQWDMIQDVIDERELELSGILITHCHYDHIGGLVNNPNDVKIFAHQVESENMNDPTMNLSYFGNQEIKVSATDFLSDGEIFDYDGFSCQVIEVAGHTSNSLCFYFEEDGLVFTGDTLFKSSIGRTDFHGYSPDFLVENIKEKLLVLPKETAIYPGHGPLSKISIEIKLNYYLK